MFSFFIFKVLKCFPLNFSEASILVSILDNQRVLFFSFIHRLILLGLYVARYFADLCSSVKVPLGLWSFFFSLGLMVFSSCETFMLSFLLACFLCCFLPCVLCAYYVVDLSVTSCYSGFLLLSWSLYFNCCQSNLISVADLLLLLLSLLAAKGSSLLKKLTLEPAIFNLCSDTKC